jgi:sorting nexin-41/42
MTQDGLESKRERLDDLEKSEREARRLEDALGRGRAGNLRPPPRSPTQGDGEDEGQIVNAEEASEPQAAYLPPHPGPNSARRKASPTRTQCHPFRFRWASGGRTS